MKLTDEEINKASDKKYDSLPCRNAFWNGARFAESHYVPLIEAHEWLIIDTPEKKMACLPPRETDECFQFDGKGWRLIGRDDGEFYPYYIYRRRISWNKVTETPIPKGVPVWLCFNGQVLLSQSGCENPHCDATHWRYAAPTPTPPIEPEREAFEKWYATQKVVLPSFQDAAHKECCWQIWQAARSRKQE